MNSQTAPPQEVRYRPNVAAIVRDPAGAILICERSDVAGAWQFPQGGIDEGESPEQALARELSEEISLRPEHVRLVARRGPYRYLYPRGFTKRGYHGVEQIYFLVELIGEKSQINVATSHPEFRATRWIQPHEFRLAWLPEMKREVYAAVFRDFFGVQIE